MKRKKLKKRLKRQLTKRVKGTVKKEEIKPAVKIGPNIEADKYEEQNKLYNIALDRKYGGTVTAKERYINQRATLLHFCSNCNTEFYGKPSYMLGKDHQQHICTMPYGDSYGTRLFTAGGKGSHKKKKKSDDLGKRFYNMVIEDYTPKEIAKELGIPLSMVNDYFETEGLI